jgi:predicted esterase
MKKTIAVERTAHYHLLEPEGEVKQILFALHGYAELAQDFIKNFEALKESNILVIAPEALSKFYNKYRKVAASWMTSHEREDEINDYLNYLNKLYTSIQSDYPNAELSLLGFSQGVSTVFRWAAQLNQKANFSLYACSGSVPPELNKADFKANGVKKVYYYYGDDDKLLPLEKAKTKVEVIRELGLEVIERPFEGRHEVSQICIADLQA